MSPMPTFIALAVFCLCQILTRADAMPPTSDSLSDVRRTLQSAIANNDLSPLHNRPIGLPDVLFRSRWRNSIPAAVRLLVESTEANDRIVGWRLAQEYGAKMGWAESDIDKIVKEPNEDVKLAAIRSASITDAAWMTKCIERVLRDSAATTQCKQLCVLQLTMVPNLIDRIRLWLFAAGDKSLRAECIYSFSSVSSSESTIKVLAGYLDDTSIVNVAVSDDFGLPTEIRTLACQAFRNVIDQKEHVVQEIRQRCSIQPRIEHVEFFLTAMIVIHILDPKSAEPAERMMEWYDTLPIARLAILQSLRGEFSDSDRLESLVLPRIREMCPSEKCLVCQWLCSRRSHKAMDTLKALLVDPHSGVRVVAAVAITNADPLFDLSAIREDMLTPALSEPKEFMLAFQSISDAVIALALSGQSDSDAIDWLSRDRNPKYRAICDESRELLLAASGAKTTLFIPIKRAVEFEREK